MKKTEISIEATSMKCSITCNGITKTWDRTGKVTCISADNVYWEDHFSEGLSGVLDDFSPLDLMYDCGTFKKQ